MVEAAGIEPASESRSTTASTCVVYLLNLTRRRPGKRGCRHASSNSSRSRTLERRSASQPALVGAPVGPCGRSPAERAAFSLRSHCVRIVRNYRVFPRFNEDMGPRHAAIASPPPSNPGRPHTLSPIRLAARTDENIARQPRPVKPGEVPGLRGGVDTPCPAGDALSGIAGSFHPKKDGIRGHGGEQPDTALHVKAGLVQGGLVLLARDQEIPVVLVEGIHEQRVGAIV